MIRIFGWLLACLALVGCASDRARTVALASKSFEAQSLAAIDALDALTVAEAAVPPEPEEQAQERFLANVAATKGVVPQDQVGRLLRPEAADMGVADRARDATFAELRQAHLEFARIFEPVERSGPFGRTVAARAVPLLDALIVQLTVQADIVARNGPTFRGRQGAMLAELRLLATAAAPEDARRRDLLAWRSRWLAMEAEQAALQRDTAEQLIKAAGMGLALREAIIDYRRLSLADLVEAIDQGLAFASATTGRDLSALKGRTDALAAQVAADPSWDPALKALLARVDRGAAQPPAPVLPAPR